MSRKIKNLAGQIFGRLSVIEEVGRDKQHNALWLCKCSCGNYKTTASNYLTRGQTKSCGCLNKEIITKHGEWGTRIHNIWKGMRQRCNNPNHKYHPRYGGRGISVCDEWDEYLLFRDWALSNGYADNLTIDRIDNDKGYSPDNCQWLTRAENTRRAIKI